MIPATKNTEKLKLLIQSLGEERVRLNEKLDQHIFSKLGGPAEGFYIATTQRELIQILDLAYDLSLPYVILGSGTKTLVSEKGMEGLVIKNRTSNIKISGIKGKASKTGIGIEEAILEIDSGVSLGKFNEYLKQQNLEEFNGFSSLHATVGGAIFLDPVLGSLINKIKVWEGKDVFEIELPELKRSQVVVSVILKVKAKA